MVETITMVEFTLAGPMVQFNAEEFKRALSKFADISKVRIASIKPGSTRVELTGDTNTIVSIVRSLKSSQETLHEFASVTGLKTLVWITDGTRYELSVSEMYVSGGLGDGKLPANPATQIPADSKYKWQLSELPDELEKNLGTEPEVFLDPEGFRLAMLRAERCVCRIELPELSPRGASVMKADSYVLSFQGDPESRGMGCPG